MSKFEKFLENTIELEKVQGGRHRLIDQKICDGNTVNVYEHTFLGIVIRTSTEVLSGDTQVG